MMSSSISRLLLVQGKIWLRCHVRQSHLKPRCDGTINKSGEKSRLVRFEMKSLQRCGLEFSTGVGAFGWEFWLFKSDFGSDFGGSSVGSMSKEGQDRERRSEKIGSFVYDVTLGGGKRQGIVCDRSAEFWTAFMLWMKL